MTRILGVRLIVDHYPDAAGPLAMEVTLARTVDAEGRDVYEMTYADGRSASMPADAVRDALNAADRLGAVSDVH